ncbi:hypothetical protein BH11BAC3_BH11BAC3_44590 [soil metagenome]
MKYNWKIYTIICVALCNVGWLNAQDTARACKVEAKALMGTYAGECKNGFADGKGDAKGMHHYVGIFKFGLPNGKGIYNFSDKVYYSGNFQEGLKEGKGEMHYLRDGAADSVVKGYWSADVYRGKSYKTYNVTEMPSFDRVDIDPSDESGNTFTIEISTTSSQPNDQFANNRYQLSVTDVIAKDGSNIRKLETPFNSFKFSATYELTQFPVKLQVMLSNARTINLELYKKAKWMMKIFINK